jgi:hydroxymethylglutaryl-CoA lyase
MAKDELVGNMATETILSWLQEHQQPVNINAQAFSKSLMMADQVFPPH